MCELHESTGHSEQGPALSQCSGSGNLHLLIAAGVETTSGWVGMSIECIRWLL